MLSRIAGPITTSPFTLFEHLPSQKNERTGQVTKITLKYDINALADFEQETGMGFGQLMSTKAIFATARALLWAGMKHERRAVTIEQVGTMLGEFVRDGGDVGEVLTAVFKAAAEQGALGKEGMESAAKNEAINTTSVEPPVGNGPALVPGATE
jgi:hypothetical protein